MNKDLKRNYTAACNDYLKAFCKKHDYEYDPEAWVSSYTGTTACVSDYFVDIQTIITDIDNDAPETEFEQWYDYCLRVAMFGGTYPNYKSWLRGYIRFSEEELVEREEKHRQIEEMKRELEQLASKEYDDF